MSDSGSEPRERHASPVAIEQLLAHERFVRELAGAITRDSDAASDRVQETWAQALERPPRHGANARLARGRAAARVVARAQERAAAGNEPGRAEDGGPLARLALARCGHRRP